VALSYAMHGTAGGRAAWARHHQDPLMDSVMSDFSAAWAGRPGIGDKMFSHSDHGMPLAAITASPTESTVDKSAGNRTSFDYDSIIDGDCGSADDSLFEKTGHRMLVSSDSDSVFGYDDRVQCSGLLPPNHFRPLSVLSLGRTSTHSPMKDDDMMISVSHDSRIFSLYC
jgi:serine/arginine repetitive matrix protein 2